MMVIKFKTQNKMIPTTKKKGHLPKVTEMLIIAIKAVIFYNI